MKSNQMMNLLIGCEEFLRLLQMTCSKRYTLLNGMMNRAIGSGLVTSCSVKKSKAVVRYGRARWSRTRSKSPAGQ